uniref:Replication factor A C-terminal domain-containing protein n=1 Tax=Tanacetum cinerariifolium TaxID=118510 RepID=A0A6L2NF08_TANCI|nr:hypothetical protein [Tanacetum cinerariifolium]
MEADTPTTITCTVIAVDHLSLHYTVCSSCERTLPDNNTQCCCNQVVGPTSKLLFRVLMSVATDTKVIVVVAFDRAAKVLFGCSAQHFLDFANIYPFSAETASKILEGEMLRVTLSKPKNGNAQHQRVVSVVPLKSDFRPVIETLSEIYGVRSG